MLATDDPLRSQFSMDARTAIDVPSLVIGRANVLDQLFVLSLTATWQTITPGVIAAF
jgi:hypothetical protein